MDVRLSPEQQALRDAAAQVVDRLGPRAVRELDDFERAEKLDAAVAASGWRQLRSSEDGGAPLASGVEAAIVAEELGRRLADVPFLGPTLATELRRLAGAPAASSAETVALQSSLSGLAVAVVGLPLPGAVAVDARAAASALALVPSDGLYLLAEVGLQRTVARTDLTRPGALADPASEATLIDQDRPFTEQDLATWTALGLTLTCADLVGTMRGAVELSVDYARSRQQFGRPIGSFQALQHLLVDALVLTEGSCSVTRHAAWAVDALPGEAALGAAATAKAYCAARAARTVCETSIQVHGGTGNTWECLAHVHLRRALVSGAMLGGAGASLERVQAHHRIGGGDGLR